jgi:hypothetical protein
MSRSAGDDGDTVTVSVAGRDGLNEEEAMERAKAVMIALTAFGRRSGGRAVATLQHYPSDAKFGAIRL